MDRETIQKAKDFSIAFATKAIATTQYYREQLAMDVGNFWDCQMSPDQDWDPTRDDLTDEFTDYFECCRQHARAFTKEVRRDIRNSIEIAMEIFIAPIGLLWLPVDDLKKAFGGTIPNWVCKKYKRDLNAATTPNYLFICRCPAVRPEDRHASDPIR